MQARLRAQLGDRSKYSGERRRRSVVVASIVLTITDPLRGSCPLQYYLQAALIRSCGASFACMELTIISRFQRPQASTKILLQSLFYSFSVLSPKACPYVMAESQISTRFHTKKASQWRLFLWIFILCVRICNRLRVLRLCSLPKLRRWHLPSRSRSLSRRSTFC